MHILQCQKVQHFCKVTLIFFSGYHDIPWGFQALLKLEKILQQTSWAGWQHSDDKWSEAVLDPLFFTGLESYQTWWWTHIYVYCNRQELLTLPDHPGFTSDSSGVRVVHVRLWIFCVISVGCCWFVSVLPWFISCPRLLFFHNPSRAMAIS